MVHVTNDDAGFYDLELAAANVNYVGRAMLALTDAANHCPVFHEFMILPANVYDSIFLGTDQLDVSVIQWLGTAVATPGTAGVPSVDPIRWATGLIPTPLTTGVPITDWIPTGWRQNTAQAGAGSTITLDASASATDSFYKYALVMILSGTGAGQARIITGYVGATKVATVTPAWVTNPSSSSVFVIMPLALADIEAWLATAPATPATAGIPDVNAKNWNNLATVDLPLAPATAGRKLVVDAAGLGDANAVKVGPTGAGSAQTARDLGASVLLSAGTGTGQLDFTAGVVKANLAQILGTALTETAGQIAAAFKQFFDVASPTGTMKAITNVATVTDLTNAPGAGDFTATMKTSLNAATPAVTVSDKTGFSLSSGGVAAIWDALLTGITTASSIGKLLKDNVDATISSRSSHSAADIWAVATRLLSAGTNIVLAKGTGVTGFNDLSAAAVNAEVDTALADYDGPTHTELTAELASADDATLAAIAGLQDISLADIFTYAYEGSETVEQGLRLFRAVLAGKIDGAAGTTIHARDAADTKNRVTATVDGDGNRSAVTTDLT